VQLTKEASGVDQAPSDNTLLAAAGGSNLVSSAAVDVPALTDATDANNVSASSLVLVNVALLAFAQLVAFF
jgi:hypothetical protein